MDIREKRKLANLSIWIIIGTVIIIVLFFIGLIITNAFDLKVFANKSADFLLTLFGASLVLVICGAFLSISLNIGIIADSRTKEEVIETVKPTKRTLYISVSVFVLFCGFLFLGDALTRMNEKKVLTKQSEEIVIQCDSSIKQISNALSDSNLIAQIPDILRFIGEQNVEFPNVQLITSDKYKGQLVLLKIDQYMSSENLKKPLYGFSIFSSDQYDSEYLKEIFTTNSKEYLFWSKEDDYKLYYPIDKGGKKFVLLFGKTDRYGKIGS